MIPPPPPPTPCANWALRKSATNCEDYVKQCIENNFYMDDLLKSMSNEKDLIQSSSKLLMILSDCGFRLTKFMSNSVNVLNRLPAREFSPKIKKLDLTEYPVERALGMLLDLKEDIFTFTQEEEKYQNTKRGILSFTASIFDPPGILTPFTLEPKLLIQKLWSWEIDWDEKILLDLQLRWEKWQLDFQNVTKVYIPRWYRFHQANNAKIKLIVFYDASAVAYGCVAYLQYRNTETRDIKCSPGPFKIAFIPFKKHMHDNPKIRVYSYGIKHSDERKKFKPIRCCC